MVLVKRLDVETRYGANMFAFKGWLDDAQASLLATPLYVEGLDTVESSPAYNSEKCLIIESAGSP